MNEGVARGDVSHNSDAIWARVDKNPINLLYWVDSTTYFAGKMRIESLMADTRYFYKL
jgi:phosphodiesterase/alkaline phosphatase D-like protein